MLVNDLHSYVSTGKSYAETYKKFALPMKELKDIIKLYKNKFGREPKTFLDVGAASGEYMSEVTEKLGLSCTGIELSREGIDNASRGDIPHVKVGSNLFQCDARKMTKHKELKGKSFDIIYTNFLWYGNENDLDTILRECIRMGGRKTLFVHLLSYVPDSFSSTVDEQGKETMLVDYGDKALLYRPKNWWLRKFGKDHKKVYDSGTTLAFSLANSRDFNPCFSDLMEAISTKNCFIYYDSPHKLPNIGNVWEVHTGLFSYYLGYEIDKDGTTCISEIPINDVNEYYEAGLPYLLKMFINGEFGSPLMLYLRNSPKPITVPGLISYSVKDEYVVHNDPYLCK